MTAPLDLKEVVRQRYSEVAEGTATCESLCGCTPNAQALALALGYSGDELQTLPRGANLGLSCGNPQVMAELKPGQWILDLGSGRGIDALLAAQKVGPTGRVVGVDMTDAMLERARANAKSAGFANVEFRKGDIESLPVDDGLFDVVLSNCVLNLCTDKDCALREIYRAQTGWEACRIGHGLDKGTAGIGPSRFERDRRLHRRPLVLDDYLRRLSLAGFRDIHVERHPETARLMIEFSSSAPIPGVENLLSVNVLAFR